MYIHTDDDDDGKLKDGGESVNIELFFSLPVKKFMTAVRSHRMERFNNDNNGGEILIS